MRRPCLLRPLAVCLSLTLAMVSSSSHGGPPDTPTDPNVLWSFVDNISACPAGDSVIAGHPFCVRIAVTYKDADDNPRVGVPPESIWVTYATTSGNARFNDKAVKIYADDSTNAAGKTRIVVRSLSGSGTVRTTLRVANVSQGNKDVHVRTTDPDASGRDSLGSDQSSPGDIDWSGGVTQADSTAAAAHLYHWRRNVLHGTLVQRTNFDGVNVRRGDSRDFWSPSGRYISLSVHLTPGNSPCYIFIVASEPPDPTLRQVTFPPPDTLQEADDYDPCWSPLNHTLIYGRGDTTIFAHSLVGFGGDSSTYIVARHHDGDIDEPTGAILGTISPDGQWVVFCRRSMSPGPIELYKVPISGDATQLRKLTKLTQGTDWYPQWSPDGQWIVFQRQIGGRFGLYRVRADGDSLQTPDSVYTDSKGKPASYDAATASYSPDGRVILAGIGPNVPDSVFTHTLDPSLATIPAIPNYAETRFAAHYVAAFPILGPLLSPDGTRLEIGANQVWAARRNMRLPPRITSVKWLNISPNQITSIDDTTVVYEHSGLPFVPNAYQLSGTDAEGDTLWWAADVLGQGMSFDSTTRTLYFQAPTLGDFYYGRVRVSERSGGSDYLILQLHAVAQGGLAGSRAGKETALPTVGPNPTRGGFVFPAPTAEGPKTAFVFDLAGRRVAVLRARAGTALSWDGKGPDGALVPPGLYLYRMEAGRVRSHGKIAVIR